MYIGRTFVDVTVDEDHEHKYGKVVDVVVEKSRYLGLLNNPMFKFYNHKIYSTQQSEYGMIYQTCNQFPPWSKKLSPFVWDPEN